MHGLAWMALASSLFALMGLLARCASEHASWALIAAVRAWVGALVAVGVARLARRELRVRHRALAWGRSVFGFLAMALGFYAMGAPDIALGDIASLRATGPLLIAVLGALFLKERPSKAVFLAVPLAFVGVLVLFRPTFDAARSLVLLTLLGTLCSAVAMLFLRRLGPHESPEAVALHVGVVAGMGTTVLALLVGVPPQREGVTLALVTGLAGGLGQLCMNRAYAKEQAAAVSAMGYLSVALTHFGAFAVLGEALGSHALLGGGLIVAAGVLLATGRVLEDRLGSLKATFIGDDGVG